MSLLLASLWVITACIIALIPSRRHHWPQAYALMVAAIPILALIYREHGTLWTLLALLCAASILRWPVRYFVAWLRRKLRSPDRDADA